jgi:two-component system OmpR family response regulator
MTEPFSLKQDRLSGFFTITCGISIDFDRCVVSVGETESLLTAREITLLSIFVQAPCRYHTTRSLALRISRDETGYPISDHSVEQTMSSLRRKLGEDGKKPRFLFCRRGIGYGLFPESSQVPGKKLSANRRASV